MFQLTSSLQIERDKEEIQKDQETNMNLSEQL